MRQKTRFTQGKEKEKKSRDRRTEIYIILYIEDAKNRMFLRCSRKIHNSRA